MKTPWRITLFSCAGLVGATLLSSRQTEEGDLPPVGSPGGPERPLSELEAQIWMRGRAMFDKDFHHTEGLGTPELNADSCRACHQFPAMGGAGGLDLNVFRFGQDNGLGGNFMDLPGGQAASKLRPPYVDFDTGTIPIETDREEHDPTANVFEQRQTPSLFGLGLVDTIPDAEILMREDPNDLDADGVRGIARRIDVNGVEEVGRFGWKAQIPRLGDFLRDAMAGECGITTPADGRGFGLTADGDEVLDPELSQTDFDDALFFLLELAAPRRTNPTDPQVLQGEMLFESVGCATCHTPVLLGDLGPVPLYSNLLLHNVHGQFARGMGEPGAPPAFFRTPPLWGIGGTAPYMHDGRAETLSAAILDHEFEAETARANYEALTPAERQALLAFLEDL